MVHGWELDSIHYDSKTYEKIKVSGLFVVQLSGRCCVLELKTLTFGMINLFHEEEI